MSWVGDIYFGMSHLLRRALNLPTGLTSGDCLSDDVPAAKAQIDGPCRIADLFFGTEGRIVHKWAHYLPIYERYFAPFSVTSVRFLEIGVGEGGSLDLWRRYFGPDATIFGIDINPACASRAEAPNQVRIGSQDDPDFLRRVVSEMGGPPQIVLDDGSHIGRQQRVAFETLFPLLAPGGLYIIEDTQTSYYYWFDGGYRRSGTAIEFAKTIVDDMHAWYHGRRTATNAKKDVAYVSFHDGIVVIEKRRRASPLNIRVGEGAPDGGQPHEA
jgi:hypothetical protein